MQITLATSDFDIGRCYQVMAELRPQLDASGFVARVQRLLRQGYQLALLEDATEVKAVAGYWLRENLAWGRHVYLDDLVSSGTDRGHGYGGALFDWLVEQARAAGCAALHLDSGVQRFGAHRFYLRRRMDITAHHFALPLKNT
jgi:GNAT superfamily N-acetyltransferase